MIKNKRTQGKIKKDYGMPDYYKFFKKEHPELDISNKKFYNVIADFNKKITEMIIEDNLDYQLPYLGSSISIKKLKDGTFEAFIEYEGVAIPISKLSEAKVPLFYAYDAFKLGKGFVESLKSRDELKQYVKKYVPDAKMNTKDVLFGNHNIYSKPIPVKPKSNQAENSEKLGASFSVFSEY